MNDADLLHRLERAERQIQALKASLIGAYDTIHHLSLLVPDQRSGATDRTFCVNQVKALRSLTPYQHR